MRLAGLDGPRRLYRYFSNTYWATEAVHEQQLLGELPAQLRVRVVRHVLQVFNSSQLFMVRHLDPRYWQPPSGALMHGAGMTGRKCASLVVLLIAEDVGMGAVILTELHARCCCRRPVTSL